ncbi:N-6 DNA methylase [Microbacterium schleiferi]|uniref:N-6 DNA methylase n=1 Tax=Microbacterium schleiferi TaxID=69362 RepID=UPI00311E184E
MTMQSHEGLLAPSDVADLAGVSRAAVSNWRKRMKDFPVPVGGSASKPLFAATDIESWLAAHPEKRKAHASANSDARAWESRLWGVANLFRGHVSIHALGELFVRTAIELIEGRPSYAPRDIGQRSIDELRYALDDIPREELARAIDGLLERTSRALGKAAGENGFVGSRTSTLLASLAKDLDGGTLYDPACGVGVALLQSLDMGARPDHIVGHEINATAVDIARGRAELRGVNIDLRVADVLDHDPDPELRADLIIAEPPFGLRVDRQTTMLDPRLRYGIPPRSSGDSFWLQHVVAHLAPSGAGYVLTSPGMLFRGGAEAEIRRNLLLSGCVRAVVALPGRMLPHTSIALALWVLSEPASTSREDVLLIDATSIETPEDEVAGWLTERGSLAEVPHARVSIDELAAGNADLSPARWVLTDAIDDAQVVEAFEQANTQLHQAVAALAATLGRVRPPKVAGEPPIMTVAKLIEAGAVEVSAVRPQRVEVAPEYEDRQVSTSDVRSGNLPPVADLPSADTSGLLTQPDDVLVTTVHGIRAVVDEAGGHFPIGHGLFRIRVVDRANLDPHYLADVLAGGWNLRFAAGTAIQRIPVRDIEIPVPPLEDQRAIHAAINNARKAKQLANQASEAADSLTTAILNAVRHGTSLTSNTTEGTTR